MPRATTSRLGPSGRAPLMLKIRPKEKSTAAHRNPLPQDTGGNQRRRRNASKNQHATFWSA